MKAAEIMRDIAGLIGAGLVSIGTGMMHLPCGLIVAGMLLIVGAVLAARAARQV